MAITLAKSFENSSTYVADIESNFTILEDEVNAILNSISGAASLSVSLGSLRHSVRNSPSLL
jgi:hypothetical protein